MMAATSSTHFSSLFLLTERDPRTSECRPTRQGSSTTVAESRTPRAAKQSSLASPRATRAPLYAEVPPWPRLPCGLPDTGDSKKADIVVFDPRTLRDKATYFEPFQYSESVGSVMVNGHFVVDGGKPTGSTG